MKKLYKLGRLRMWQKYCRIQREKHPLTYLFWECTMKCNLSCRHCGSSCGPRAANDGELATDEIKHAFRTIAEDFDAKKIMIAVTGGEALLRRDLFEVMKYASGLGFSWGMVTNGTLLTPEIVEQMKQAKISTVSVSLDGATEENHNWLRCDNYAFSKTTDGIRLLASSGTVGPVEVITCVNRRNFKELEDIYALCKKLGVDRWRIFTITPTGRAKGNSELFLSAEQITELLDFIKNKRKNKKQKPEVSFCDEGFLGLDYEGEVRDQLFYCWAGVSVGSILYNGDIAACPILPREFTTQGNVRLDRFSKIWNREFSLFRDRSWRKCGKCEDCSWWDLCEGSSLHLWDFKDNKLSACNYDVITKGKENKTKKSK